VSRFQRLGPVFIDDRSEWGPCIGEASPTPFTRTLCSSEAIGLGPNSLL